MSAVLAMTEQQDRLEWHLENWARWMGSGGTTDLRGPNHAHGCTSWGDSWDSEAVYERMERRCAGIMDAMIGSLPPAQQAAILCEYEVARAFNFPRGNYHELLVLAKAKLRSMMHSRGLV